MVVVNFFGGPGSGKSTAAARLFSRCKEEGLNVELVTEVAKDAVWEENWKALKNQLYIAGCQDFRLSKLNGKVTMAIVDSPILLSIIYNKNPVLGEHFNQTLVDLFNSYENFNIFLGRNFEYDPIGRNETEEESNAKAKEILDMLHNYNIPILMNANDPNTIFNLCKSRYMKEQVKEWKLNDRQDTI